MKFIHTKLFIVAFLLLATFTVAIYLIFYRQNCIELNEDFPSFNSFFDKDKWRDTCDADIYSNTSIPEGYKSWERHEKIIADRENMVFDLVAHHCQIISKRENALKILGKPVNIGENNFGSFKKFFRSNESNYEHEFSKDDLVYLAGRCPSGNSYLALQYDKNGDLINCGWMEAQ